MVVTTAMKAAIWHAFMVQALQIEAQENLEYGPHPKGSSTTTTETGTGTSLEWRVPLPQPGGSVSPGPKAASAL